MTLRSDRLLLDVGGTFIKCGDGRCIPMPSGGSREEIVSALQQAVADWLSPAQCGPAPAPQSPAIFPVSEEIPGQAGNDAGERHGRPDRPSAIAVAIPGPFDYERGIFLMQHKFAAVYGESFRALAGLPDNIDLRFRHDVIAALEGSLHLLEGQTSFCGTTSSTAAEAGSSRAYSAAADKLSAQQMTQDARMDVALGSQPQPASTKPAAPVPQNTALVTIGTGLGFAHSENGTVQIGPTGSPARSIYNLPWGDGILEDAVSARGIRNAYTRLTGRTDLSTAQIAHLAEEGDDAAMEVFSDMGGILGEALAPVLEELSVGTLLLAGQVSRSLPLFERPLRNALDGIYLRPAPEGAVFAGLRRLFDPPAGLDATDH